MNDHSGHGAGRVTGKHRHDLTGAAGHAGHGQGHEHLSHAGHADVYRRRFWITLILAVPVVVYSGALVQRVFPAAAVTVLH